MLAILISLLLLAICLVLIKFKRRFELGRKIPGPWYIPFVGNVQFATMKPEGVFLVVNELRQKYKRSFRLWLGVNLWIFLHSPEETKQALNSSMLPRSNDFKLLQPLVGDGLLLSEGKKWNTRRKALNPAFHPKVLDGFIDSFCYHADIFVKNLLQNEKTEISNQIFLCVLDTICETAMGVKINSQTDPSCIYGTAFHDASRLLFQRMVNPLLAIDAVYKYTSSAKQLDSAIKAIHELTEKVIKDRKEIQSEISETDGDLGIRKKQALLDVLLNIQIDGKPLSDEDIKEEVNTFLFAGVDTTQSSMSFILYNLGKYKELQTEIVEEIWSIIGKDTEQTIEINNINEMKHLDLFIKETLRYHTTVPLTSRQIKKEMLIGDMLVPKGAAVWINMYGLAHDPDLFENPDEFIPGRFDTDDERNTILPYTYLPFAGGPRICIGKKYSLLMMKAIVIKVLLHHEISLAYPDEKLELISEMVLKSTNGINLVFQKRK